MQEIYMSSRPAIINENDLLSMKEAAELSGRSMSSISQLMDRLVLPWYQLRGVGDVLPNERVQRFTSRKAVLALPKKSGD